MSEAELHVLRARLLGGQLNKARRGELWMRPPIGFVYDRDPAARARSRRADSSARCACSSRPSAGPAPPSQVVRHFAREGILWPRRLVHRRPGRASSSSPRWSTVASSGILHNPRYAGAFVYGRTRQRKVRHRRADALSASAPRRVEGLPAQRPPGLRHVGGVRDESGDAPHQCPRLRARSPPQSGARRRRAPAGPGALRPLRRPDDRPLRRPRRASGARLRLPAARRSRRAQRACQIIPGTGLDEAVAPGRARGGDARPRSTWRSRSSTSSGRARPRSIACAARRSSAPARRPSWPSASSCSCVRNTGWSPTRSNGSGTRSWRGSPRPRRTYRRAGDGGRRRAHRRGPRAHSGPGHRSPARVA